MDPLASLFVKVELEGKIKYLSNQPSTYAQLLNQICTVYEDYIENINEYNFNYVDMDGENILIENSNDLLTCYIIHKNIMRSQVKIVLRAKNTQKSCTQDIRDSAGYIIRKGLAYYCRSQSKNNKYYSCSYSSKCQGSWTINKNEANVYGKQRSAHAIKSYDHPFYNESSSNKKKIRVFSKNRTKRMVTSLLLDRPDIGVMDILVKVLEKAQNANLPPKKQIDKIISNLKHKLSIKIDGTFTNTRTIRGTKFTKEPVLLNFNKKPTLLLYIHSKDFQRQILRQTHKDLHIFIDGTYRSVPSPWKQLVTVIIHSKMTKQCYIPVLHVLTQSNKKEVYLEIFKYLRIKNNDFEPKFITSDYEDSIIQAIKESFQQAIIVPCFFHFTQALWHNANRLGYHKKEFMPEIKEIIVYLQSLAFCEEEYVIERFNIIMNRFDDKYKRYFEYFKRTWIDAKYNISLWNYSKKGIKHGGIKTNNCVESFHRTLNKQCKGNKSTHTLINALKSIEGVKQYEFTSKKNQEINHTIQNSPVEELMQELLNTSNDMNKILTEINKILNNLNIFMWFI